MLTYLLASNASETLAHHNKRISQYDIKLQPGTILRIRFEREMTIPLFETDRAKAR